MEIVPQATIAKSQGVMAEMAFGQIYAESEELARMLSVFDQACSTATHDLPCFSKLSTLDSHL
jgi:hypothetical protein